MSLTSAKQSGDLVVDVQAIAKSYSGWSIAGRKKIDALKGVSLSAQPGEVFGLLGPNGAGKTTLIKILLGVVTPTTGSASLFGEPVGSSAARRRVGYLPESLRVDRHHTARSALRYYGRLSRMNAGQIAKRSDELLELVGLQGRDRESVRRFSKGMNQRLGLAQALMHDPDLLVLDEPTDGLDPVGRTEVRRVIERLRDAGKTIFLNSHILQEVEMVCTRVAVLAKGEIRGAGTLAELSSKMKTEQVTLEVCVPGNEGAHGIEKDRAQLTALIEQSGGSEIEVQALDGEDRSHRVVAMLPEQSQIDATVDRLRTAGISIVRLQVDQPTLEDTFMKLVGTTEAGS